MDIESHDKEVAKTYTNFLRKKTKPYKTVIVNR